MWYKIYFFTNLGREKGGIVYVKIEFYNLEI